MNAPETGRSYVWAVQWPHGHPSDISRTDIEQPRIVFDPVRCPFALWFCNCIPKPTGLGMVSFSSFSFSLPLIRLPLRVGHIPFATAARHTRLSDLLQRILKPRREEGCVLLEFTDRRLGNLLDNLAEDFTGLDGASPCQCADQLPWRLIPQDELPVGNMLEGNRQSAQLI